MRAFLSQGDAEHLTALGFKPGILYCTQSATLRVNDLLRHGRSVIRGDYPTAEPPRAAVLVVDIYQSGLVQKDEDWQISTRWGQTFDASNLLGVVAKARLVAFSPNLTQTPVVLARQSQVRIFAYVPLLGRPVITPETVCEGVTFQKIGVRPVAKNPKTFFEADDMDIVS